MTTNAADEVFGADRAVLNFESAVKEIFAFLSDFNFSITESSPTIVRYGKSDMQVDIYHGRQSYEIGLGITWKNLRYELVDFIAVSAPEKAAQYIKPMASAQISVTKCLNDLAELTKEYCDQALKGDWVFFLKVVEINKLRIEKYWLEMKARQLRPQANEAFRLKKYREAVDLYEQIEPCLSLAELKKLSIARKSMGSDYIDR